ncbi:MAG: TolC family protein [Bacteroidaceae bacterium]|nr:TolC family protein [Bacteroidaceae bacterium]
MKKYRKILVASLLTFVSALASGQEHPSTWDLRSCIDYAKEHNISILQSRNQQEQTAVSTKSAKAQLFPSLSFTASQTYANQPYGGNGSTGDSYNDGTINTYSGSYRLGASWEFYNGGKNTKNIKLAQLNEQMAVKTTEELENQTELAILQAYMQILYATESIRINQETLVLDSATLARGLEQKLAGMLTRADIAQLESQLSTDRYQLVKSQTTLESYKLQLKQLLELSGQETLSIYTPEVLDAIVLRTLPNKQDVYNQALGIMPEIQNSKLASQAAELQTAIAKAGYMPTLSLSASTATGHTSGSEATLGKQLKNGWNNNIGLSLSVPIFDNRTNKSAVEKAKLQLINSQLSELDEQKTLYKTIETAWLDAYSAQNEFLAAKEKADYASVSYELASEQFKAGMKNTVELLTEKNTLLSAQQQKLQTKYMALLNQKILEFYQGTAINL